MQRSLRSDTKIIIIGFEQFQMLGTKLPTSKEVLQVFFYNLRTLKMKLRESSTLAVREAILFWNKAGIPTRQEPHCIEKLEKIYNEWRGVCKNLHRQNEHQKKVEEEFLKNINQLFDIAHSNAMNMISKDGQTFLINQRSENRVGGLAGVDRKAMQKAKRRNDRIEKETERKRRHYENETLAQQGYISNIFSWYASH